jgi:hypothetical protein
MTDKKNQRELIVEIMKADEKSGLYDNTNMKNTAVEMFATKVMSLDITPKQMHYFLEWFEQAKQMEEHQIAEAHTSGFLAGDNNVYRGGYVYYQETYKK